MIRSKNLTRIFTAAAVAFALALGAVFLSACGQNSEQLIRDSLTEELESIKSMDESFMAEMEADSTFQQLEEFGIDANTFFTSYLSGFDYRIDDVTVDGDTATATVVLTVKSINDFMTEFESQSMALLDDPSIYTLSMDEMYDRIGTMMMDVLDGLPANETDPITITYELVDNTWTPTAEGQQAINAALMG